ncbi:condensation protein [Rhodococcus sp. HNM0569]|uniref:condensation protein n=1 Tax=Rhodococcus sp. HNM0569 TaxID=2716340 RepID=UPI001F0F69C4|nr:condensation protein [Rhodococcus sp. HNM0569]
MKVTSIDRYVLEPGVVTEWLVSPTVARRSATPPSYNQRFHLDTARTHGVGRSVWMAAAFDLPGELDRDALELALRHFIARHDTLHSGFDVGPEHMHRVDFDPAQVAVTASTPVAIDDAGELRDHLRTHFTEVCDPLTYPAYTFATVERAGHHTVISAFDHTLVDGYSLVIALGELRSIYESFSGREGSCAGGERDASDTARALTEKLGDAGSFLSYCRLESEQPAADPDDPRIGEWGRFYARCGGTAPSFPLDLGVEPGRPAPQGADVRELLGEADTAAFEELCVAGGGSLFTGTLTAIATALESMGASSVLPMQFPLHTRRDPQWANAIGWLTTSAPIVVEVDGDFVSSLRATHAAFRHALTLGGVTMSQVIDSLGSSYRRTRTDVFMVSYIDYRKLPGTADHERLNAHHISNVTMADDAQFWISRTTRGLALRSRFPDTAVANATIADFLDVLTATLESVAGGGVAPVAAAKELVGYGSPIV